MRRDGLRLAAVAGLLAPLARTRRARRRLVVRVATRKIAVGDRSHPGGGERGRSASLTAATAATTAATTATATAATAAALVLAAPLHLVRERPLFGARHPLARRRDELALLALDVTAV